MKVCSPTIVDAPTGPVRIATGPSLVRIVGSELQPTGIIGLNGRFQAASSADRVASPDPLQS
jgi:hypothetical protein